MLKSQKTVRALTAVCSVLALPALLACGDSSVAPDATSPIGSAAFARKPTSNPGSPDNNQSCDTDNGEKTRRSQEKPKNACAVPGSITIVKKTNSTEGTFTFNPSSNLDAGGSFTLTPSASNSYEAQRSISNLSPGITYTVHESAQTAPWAFTSLTCTGGLNSTITTTGLSGREASITLADGENITCTYTNTYTPLGPSMAWNLSALGPSYPYVVMLDLMEDCVQNGDVGYTAYNKNFGGNQGGFWGTIELCGSENVSSLWDIRNPVPPTNDGKGYNARFSLWTGGVGTLPGFTLSGDKSSSCTDWTWDAGWGYVSFCSVVNSGTTIIGVVP